MTAREMLEALREHYLPPWWVFLIEVDVSPYPVRRLDALAISCSRAQRFATFAFEVKASRKDFLDELANPEKRQAALAISNEFYFVTPPGLVGEEELPEEAGLIYIYPDGKRRFVRMPPWRNRECPSWELIAAIAKHGEM